MPKRNTPGAVVQAAREHGYLIRFDSPAMRWWKSPDGNRVFSHAAVRANIIAGTLLVTEWLGMLGKGGIPLKVVPTGVEHMARRLSICDRCGHESRHDPFPAGLCPRCQDALDTTVRKDQT